MFKLGTPVQALRCCGKSSIRTTGFTAIEYGLIALHQKGYQGQEEHFVYWFHPKVKVTHGDSDNIRAMLVPAPSVAKHWLLLTDVLEDMPLSSRWVILAYWPAWFCGEYRSRTLYTFPLSFLQSRT